MRQRLAELAIILGGIVAALSPTALAAYVADQEGLKAERSFTQTYAHDALFRSDEVADQMMAAFASLSLLEAVEGACGPRGLAEMRRIDLSSRYIQAVGRISGNRMNCSSLGLQGDEFIVGAADFVQPNGSLMRTNVRFPFAPHDSFLVVERGGFGAIIHKDLPIDTALEVEDIVLATFSTANGAILASRGTVDPAWIERFRRTGETHFVAGSHAVSINASGRYVIGSLAAMPASTAFGRVGGSLTMVAPVGIAAGALIAGLFIHFAHSQRALPSVLRHALRKNEFHLVYQPVVDLRTGRWIGAEALIRWRRETGETISPELFVPVAEAQGLIGEITRSVVAMIARDAAELFADRRDFHIAFNVSGSDIHNEATIRHLDRLAFATGAAAGNLVVEITERSFTDGRKAAAAMERLRARGFKVAIDDFGTGYSNIGLLQTLRLDCLKIDKSFVDSIGAEAATSDVVRHIVAMGKSLGLEIVAEGVETEEQVDMLLAMGVRRAQGWLFARPMSYENLMEALARQDEQAVAPIQAFGPGAAGQSRIPGAAVAREYADERRYRQAVS